MYSRDYQEETTCNSIVAACVISTSSFDLPIHPIKSITHPSSSRADLTLGYHSNLATLSANRTLGPLLGIGFSSKVSATMSFLYLDNRLGLCISPLHCTIVQFLALPIRVLHVLCLKEEVWNHAFFIKVLVQHYQSTNFLLLPEIPLNKNFTILPS